MKERLREAFLKHQSRMCASPTLDEGKLAGLYAEFAEEDRELAEEGMADYSAALTEEDELSSNDC
jgi:hypothetical protein